MSNYAPPIPDINLNTDIEIKRILDPIKETIDIMEGRKSAIPNERSVTLQDLLDLELITQDDIDNKVTR